MRHIGYAHSSIVCLCDAYRIALHRRSLVNNKHVMLGSMPRQHNMQLAHIAVANDESKPLMLGSL